MTATAFLRGALPAPDTAGVGGARVGDLLAITERILGPELAERSLREYCEQAGRHMPRLTEPADRGLLQSMERVLAGAIGASSARLVFTHALGGRGIAAEEVAELLDETSQELRFSRQLLQATMENVSQGIAVADAEARIVAWNRRYLEMFDYPEGMVYVGRPVADLIRWNAERGEFGDTDTEGFLECQADDILLRSLVHGWALVQVGRDYLELPASQGEKFPAPGRSGGEDQHILDFNTAYLEVL